ncbi:MAG: 30S ribosomal protein S5 [Patescibacteria group bacterium]
MAQGRGKSRDGKRFKKEKPEFDQHIVDLARVTRVTKGGKQLSFRACVVIGDRKGRVGYGLDKGKDVQIAVEKAVNQAKKAMIYVPIEKKTIPHRVEAKFKAGRVMIKPAPQGSGIIAGSSIRTVLELAGVPNASAKMMGRSNNKVVNVKATFKALQSFLQKAKIVDKRFEQRKDEKKKDKLNAGNEDITDITKDIKDIKLENQENREQKKEIDFNPT